MQGNSLIYGDIRLQFSPDAEQNRSMLPLNQFCVRKVSAVFAKGRHWIYADVIPWSSPSWPHTKGTSIHAFSSPDCKNWTWHGEMIALGAEGQWDRCGVATPGAIVHNDRVYIFYNGQELPEGKGHRDAGMAISDDPAGPFIKNPEPILTSEGQLDDFCPILSADGKGIDLYFRLAMHHQPPPNYSICLVNSSDGGKTWSKPVTVLHSDNEIRAYETAEVKRIGGQVLMSCFEHRPHDYRVKTSLMISSDGCHFEPCKDRHLDDHLLQGWPIPECSLQWCLIPSADSSYHYIGVVQSIDALKHNNLIIMPISPLR